MSLHRLKHCNGSKGMLCKTVEPLWGDAGVDIAMNTHLKNVKLILKGQPAQPLDGMSVRGNQIRRATPCPLFACPRPTRAASPRTIQIR